MCTINKNQPDIMIFSGQTKDEVKNLLQSSCKVDDNSTFVKGNVLIRKDIRIPIKEEFKEAEVINNYWQNYTTISEPITPIDQVNENDSCISLSQESDKPENAIYYIDVNLPKPESFIEKLKTSFAQKKINPMNEKELKNLGLPIESNIELSNTSSADIKCEDHWCKLAGVESSNIKSLNTSSADIKCEDYWCKLAGVESSNIKSKPYYQDRITSKIENNWRKLSGLNTEDDFPKKDEIIKLIGTQLMNKLALQVTWTNEQVLAINGIPTKYTAYKLNKALEGLIALFNGKEAMDTLANLIVNHMCSLYEN